MGHHFILCITIILFIGQVTGPVFSLESGSGPGSGNKIEKAVQDANTDQQIPPSVAASSKSNDNSHIKSSLNSTKCENATGSATTNCSDDKTFYGKMMTVLDKNKAMLLRTMYVLIALTSIVVVYFVVRAFRLRHRRNKSRKYGLITTPNDLEMAPLDQDDEDEDDMTVFELNDRKR